MIKWIFIIFVVLSWLYRLGKREMAKQEAQKRAKADTDSAAAANNSALDARAQRMALAAARVAAMRQEIEAKLRELKVDPYKDASADSAYDNVDDDNIDDDEVDEDETSDTTTPVFDDTPPAAPYVAPLPAAPLVRPLPPPPVVYAMADDTSNIEANAEVRRAIEAVRHAHAPPPLPKPTQGLTAASSKSATLVRDSVIMQTLLQRHPRNYLFRTRR